MTFIYAIRKYEKKIYIILLSKLFMKKWKIDSLIAQHRATKTQLILVSKNIYTKIFLGTGCVGCAPYFKNFKKCCSNIAILTLLTKKCDF